MHYTTQMVQRFRNEPALRVALLSVTAAGTGLDFSAASLVVFAELPSEVGHADAAWQPASKSVCLILRESLTTN